MADENNNGIFDENELFEDFNGNGVFELDYLGNQDCCDDGFGFIQDECAFDLAMLIKMHILILLMSLLSFRLLLISMNILELNLY